MKVNSYFFFPNTLTSHNTNLASSSTIPVSGSCSDNSRSCLAWSLLRGPLSSVFHASIRELSVINSLKANTKAFSKSFSSTKSFLQVGTPFTMWLLHCHTGKYFAFYFGNFQFFIYNVSS